MPHLDTTTSASSPVEGTWCESHIMAPAVCILNPSNGTHNCRPGWRTCLGSTPSRSVRLYACACLKSCQAAPKKSQVRLASPAERWGGFGTCGWRGAGRPKPVQPLVAADVMPARVHAVRVRDYDRLRRARFTTLAALRNCFGPGQTRSPVLKVRALRHLVHDGEGEPAGWTQVARANSPGNPTPQWIA